MLAAVTEVIRAQGGKETETEYFAALVSHFSDNYLSVRLFRSCILTHCFPHLTQCASVSCNFGQTFNLKTSLGVFFFFCFPDDHTGGCGINRIPGCGGIPP